MKERFDNPPLLEIIAELRWDLPSVVQHSGVPTPVLPPLAQSLESDIEGFAAQIATLGFENVERMVPQGFPWMTGGPVFRYTHNSNGQGSREELKSSTIFQIGPGVFTANAVPPYTSWDDFEPLVRHGVEAMLSMKFSSGRPKTFLPSLRYVDAFDTDLTQGMSLRDFLDSVMGLSIRLPESLISRSSLSDTEVPMTHVIVPLEFGKLMLQFIDGMVNGRRVYILDMAVHFERFERDDVAGIMEAFSGARDVIHEVFVGLTKPIHGLMKPRGNV
ncbi:TIGR04255 family protein [Pseudomonas syringae]|uniref:TIGR04255 family protein n=1 Tax=Pseudomonas syringae TaxID=317 RepID=UPI003F8283D9